MIQKQDVHIVIPAYNEAKQIGSVIQRIKKHGFNNIIVVNDCSTDNTKDVLEKLHKTHNITVLSHPINRGAGAATKTGIDFALTQNAAYVMTIDADGQHDIADAQNLLNVADKYDVVIGSRLIDKKLIKGMPKSRQLINKIGSLITFLLYGIYVNDSQSGFKIFNKKALQNIEIKFDRYEFCSEVLHEIKQKKLTYTEVAIKAIYTEYSLSKGQSFLNGVRMIYKMIMRLFLP